MKNVSLSTRMPADLRSYVQALSALTDKSLNAVVVSLLQERRDHDPLTQLRIVERRGRFVVTSALSHQTYAGFADRQAALHHARVVIEIAGGDTSNIIDDSGQGNVTRPRATTERTAS